MGVVHGEVGDDDRDGESHHQDAGHGTHGSHEHAEVGLGDHVSVPDRGHGDQRPPQAQGDGAEVVGGVDLDPLRVVDQAGEYHDTEDQEEDQQHQLLGRGSEGLQEDLEARGMTGQLEQSEDSDDAEELEDVSVLDVRDVLLEKEIRVEADSGDIINYVH